MFSRNLRVQNTRVCPEPMTTTTTERMHLPTETFFFFFFFTMFASHSIIQCLLKRRDSSALLVRQMSVINMPWMISSLRPHELIKPLI